MYTSEQINQIMQELGLSPTDASADDTRKLIEQLANAKPNVATIDANFISELRKDLQTRSANMSLSQSESNNQETKSINIFSMFINKTLVSALVVAVIVIGAGGIWYANNSDRPLFQSSTFGGGSESQLLSGKYDVKAVANESFGDLDKVAVVSTQDAAKLNSTSSSAGNNGPAVAMGTGGMPNMSTTATAEDAKLIAPGEPYPGQTYYTFKYEGTENLPGLNATQSVLKRTKPVQPESLVSRVVNLLSFGLIDLTTLQNVQLQNLSFIEDREFGYGVYVDVQQGMVNMYQNYERWPQPTSSEPAPMKVEDLPKDADVMASAETFIQQYKISKEGYGTPRIVEPWRIAYEAASATDRMSFYIPEQIQIVYPLMLENKEVYDESGNVYGLSIVVDAKTMRVASVYELMSKQFERSDYKGEADSSRILKIAENGGFRNYSYPDQQVGRKIELKLGTPTVQMVKIYYSSDNYKTSNDLYMPALIFPITNWKENNYWRQSVIVPLVKSILDSDNQQPQPIPLPMPVDVPVSNVQGSATTEPAVIPETRAR